MENPDLTYLKKGFFTTFFPETPEGEEAWCEIAAHTEGTGSIFTLHLKQTLKMLRSKGYIVRKAKKPTLTDDQLLDQLGILESPIN